MANGTAYRRGGSYWIQYRIRGKQVREPGGFDGRGARTKGEAEARLLERLAEIQTHKYIGPDAERVTVDELLDSYIADQETRRCKGTKKVKCAIAHVRRHLGTWRAVDVKRSDVDAYIAKMRTEKTYRGKPFADASINRGLQALRSAFILAVQDERLPRAPHIPMLPENNTRTGFFERAEFEAILPHLSDVEADVARFGYLTGWRLSEVLGLTWDRVDLDAGEVRLDDSKNGEARTSPIDEDLQAVLERRQAARTHEKADGTTVVSPFVFHRRGGRLARLEKWREACVAAKCPGRFFHDMRRTVVRDLTRAGVQQAVAMEITGHKTASVFHRYNIVDTADKRDGLERLRAYRATRPSKTNVVSFALLEHKTSTSEPAASARG